MAAVWLFVLTDIKEVQAPVLVQSEILEFYLAGNCVCMLPYSLQRQTAKHFSYDQMKTYHFILIWSLPVVASIYRCKQKVGT